MAHDMQTGGIEDFAQRVQRAADEVDSQLLATPHTLNLDAFRRLERYCSHYMFESIDPPSRFLCFVLTSYIELVFTNLGGDTPYDVSLQEARVSLAKLMTSQMRALSGALSGGHQVEALTCLQQMVSGYVDRINHLNAIEQR